MQANKSIFTKIKASFFYIYEVIIVGNISLLLLFQKYNHAYKRTFLFSNSTLLIVGSVVIFLFSFIYFTLKKYSNIHFEKNISIVRVSIILFFVQVYICYNMYFATGWDVGSQVIPSAQFLSVGSLEESYHGYYSRYPNNILLVSLFSFIFKINNLIGIFGLSNVLMSIIVVQCILSSITGYLIFKILKDILESQVMAWIGWLFFLLLVGSSPWLIITYSDSIGLIIPILLFRLYQKLSDETYQVWKLIAIGLLASVGYYIKPQIIIIFLAIMIIEIIKLAFDKVNRRNIFKTISIIMLVFLLTNVFYNGIFITQAGFRLDKNKAFGISHYIMMGLNEETDGAYYGYDVILSGDMKNREERKRVNIEIIQERLKEHGALGLIKHLIKKSMVNYGDGTFAWSMEGNFYMETYEDKNTFLSPLTKEIFWENGKYYPYLATIEHIMWLLTLLGSAGLGLGIKKFLRKKEQILVLVISIIGLTTFQLLFEARARYLYTYVPIYIILGISGWKCIITKTYSLYKICYQNRKVVIGKNDEL